MFSIKRALPVTFSFLAVGAPIATTVSCNSEVDKPIIGMVLTNVNNPFFKIIKDEAIKKGKENGYEVIVIDSGYDLSKESAAMTQLVTMGAKAIIFNPMNAEGSKAAAMIAKNANVPVITIDTNLKDESVASAFVATNNELGAKKLAEYVIENEPTVVENGKIKGSKLYRVAGPTGHPASLARWDNSDSFKSLVSGEPGGFVRGGFKTDTANEKFVNMTTDIKVIYTENDPMAVGVINKLKQTKSLDKIKALMIVSFDGSKAGIDLVKEGLLDATMAQEPVKLADHTILDAIKLIKKEHLDQKLDLLAPKIITLKTLG